MTQPADKSPPIPLVTKPVDQGAVLHARIDQVMTAISNLADAVADGRAEVKDFRKDVCDHFEAVDGKVRDLNDWRKSTSDRVRGVSESDMKQSADIAAVITRVDNLGEALKTSNEASTAAVIAKLDTLSKSPVVKLAITAIGSLIAGYLASHYGVHIQ